MTEAELQAIEARANAATPGPWLDTTNLFRKYYGSTIRSPNGGELTVWRFGDGVEPSAAELVESDPSDFCDSHYQTANDAADVAFIAASRSDIPALCAEVRRLQGVVRALTDSAP